MKNFYKILCLTLLFGSGLLASSCGGDGNTPVDQYVKLLEEATEEIKGINSIEELQNVESGTTSMQAQFILKESKDYVLTDSDKEKIKKASDKMLRMVFEKSLELSSLPDNIKDSMKGQADLAVDAVNKNIDKATTLGEINGAM